MKNILIDMTKYRDCAGEGCDRKVPEGIMSSSPETGGLKTVRELAVFTFTCRRCKDAPCIAVCPEDALKRNDYGMIVRSTNLCVACKSCVTICPFGTMMSDFYEYKRTVSLYFNLKDAKELVRFMRESPEGTIQFTDMEENEKKNIYQLLPGILIKDYPWEKLKKLE
jgi:Fe-S-cluster-containing hydrogenase component 2